MGTCNGHARDTHDHGRAAGWARCVGALQAARAVLARCRLGALCWRACLKLTYTRPLAWLAESTAAARAPPEAESVGRTHRRAPPLSTQAVMAPGSRPRARLEPGAPPLPVTASATSSAGGGGGSPAGAPSSSLSSAVAAQPAPGAACCSARRGCGRTGGAVLCAAAVPCAAAVLCAGALCAAGVRSSAAGVRSSTGTRSTCRSSAPCLPSAQEGLCLGLCLGLLRGGGLIRPSGLYLPSGGGLHRPPSARPAAAAGAAAAGQCGPPQTLEPCATARRPASSPCSMACWLTSETRRIEQRALGRGRSAVQTGRGSG